MVPSFQITQTNPLKLVATIQSFLSDRTYSVRVDGNTSTTKKNEWKNRRNRKMEVNSNKTVFMKFGKRLKNIGPIKVQGIPTQWDSSTLYLDSHLIFNSHISKAKNTREASSHYSIVEAEFWV